MAALARRFPGALRELDELTLEAIRGRISELSRCTAGEELPAPWMMALARFHQLMRGALVAKKWLGARRGVDSALAETFLRSLEESERAEDARAWVHDLARVARPPGGRLTGLVFERLSTELGISPSEARSRVLGPLLLRGAARRGRSL
jgi:hypothetical protein